MYYANKRNCSQKFVSTLPDFFKLAILNFSLNFSKIITKTWDGIKRMNIEGIDIDIDIEGTLILKELKGHLMSWIQYLSINSLYQCISIITKIYWRSKYDLFNQNLLTFIDTSVPSLLTKPRQFVRKRKKFDVFSATGQWQDNFCCNNRESKFL